MSALGLGACRTVRTSDRPLDIASAPADVAGVVEALTHSIPRAMARQDIPGLSIALVQRGALAWAEGFGFTDQERRVPVRADTQFSVGSVTTRVLVRGRRWATRTTSSITSAHSTRS